MPVEPSAAWWPLASVAGGIVVIGAVWFTKWVVSRLERDRSKLHEHAGKLQLHDYRLDEHDEALRDRRPHRPPTDEDR